MKKIINKNNLNLFIDNDNNIYIEIDLDEIKNKLISLVIIEDNYINYYLMSIVIQDSGLIYWKNAIQLDDENNITDTLHFEDWNSKESELDDRIIPNELIKSKKINSKQLIIIDKKIHHMENFYLNVYLYSIHKDKVSYENSWLELAGICSPQDCIFNN